MTVFFFISLSDLTRNASDWLGKPRVPMLFLVLLDKLDFKTHYHNFLYIFGNNFNFTSATYPSVEQWVEQLPLILVLAPREVTQAASC